LARTLTESKLARPVQPALAAQLVQQLVVELLPHASALPVAQASPAGDGAATADEPLIVLEGALEVEVDGQTLRFGPGQLTVIPHGQVQHPRPVGEAVLLLCERRGAAASVKL
jgi:quercetin dioxygenase-like cupin family protein